MRQFEFHAYKGDEYGAIADRPEVTTAEYEEKVSAVGYAGRMAKRIQGPVDVALAGESPWEDRYITTAAPCSYRISGSRFERLL